MIQEKTVLPALPAMKWVDAETVLRGPLEPSLVPADIDMEMRREREECQGTLGLGHREGAIRVEFSSKMNPRNVEG